MFRLAAIPFILLLLLLGAMAWSGSATEKRADFVFISQRDINTLDPNTMSYQQDIRLTYAIREGLLQYDGMTLKPKPAAAESYEVTPDKLTYTFHLRHNAKWSNGDPVTAKDFLFAWKRMLDSPGEYTYLHYYIKGAEDYVEKYSRNEPADIHSVGEEAADDFTLRVTLHDPVPFLLDLMAYVPFYPLNERSMEPFKEIDAKTGRATYNQHFTRPPNAVTNGAYVLSTWDFKQRLRLERNPNYWNASAVKLDSIEMSIVEDPLTQVMRYDSGSADWIPSVPTEVAPEMLATSYPGFHNFGGFGTTYISLLCQPNYNDGKKNPLADIRIRQALAMTVDKDFIVKNITRMGEQTSSTLIPPDIFKSLGWRSTPGIQYDPVKARKLLAEAGYPDGGSLPGVTFLFRTGSPSLKDQAQSLVRHWKETLNLDIPLEGQEPKTVRARLHKQDFSICTSDWIGDYNDPSTFTDLFLSDSANNTEKWQNPQYDQLLQQAVKETDDQKRLRLLEQAEQLLDSEAAIIPIYVLTNQYLFRDTVHGLNLDPRTTTMLNQLSVDRQ